MFLAVCRFGTPDDLPCSATSRRACIRRSGSSREVAERSEESRFPSIVGMGLVQKIVEHPAAIDDGEVSVAQLHVACILPRRCADAGGRCRAEVGFGGSRAASHARGGIAIPQISLRATRDPSCRRDHTRSSTRQRWSQTKAGRSGPPPLPLRARLSDGSGCSSAPSACGHPCCDLRWSRRRRVGSVPVGARGLADEPLAVEPQPCVSQRTLVPSMCGGTARGLLSNFPTRRAWRPAKLGVSSSASY
jgi:hypothetical protein